ncbi:uncharacterized protein [Rhodnius prolixus]|uniref:uncharacterized protein n=1 Tax=Rhodnius prolixus TaxID=13249 RepID=UPI003D18F06F
MYFRLIIVLSLFSVTTNDLVLVNDLLDPFVKERVKILGDKIQLGDISFAGTTLKNATLEGLQNLRRSGDIYAGDWYTKLWSIIFGDFKVDYLVIRYTKIIGNHNQNNLVSNTGWIKISNAEIHIHYEAYFSVNGSCKLDKELIGWKWLDELIIESRGSSVIITEDEMNKLKLSLLCEPIKNYFRQLFMYKCLIGFPKH